MTFLRIQGCWKGDGWAGCHKGAVTWRPGSSEDLDNGNPKLLRIGNGWNFPQHFHHFHFPFIEKTGWLWSCRLVENTSSQDEFVRWYSSILGITDPLNLWKTWLFGENTLIMMKFCMKTWSISSGFLVSWLVNIKRDYLQRLLDTKFCSDLCAARRWHFFGGVATVLFFIGNQQHHPLPLKDDICLGIFVSLSIKLAPLFNVEKVGCFRHGCRILSFHWQPKVLLSWSLERPIGQNCKSWTGCGPVVIHPWRIILVRLVRS